MCPCGDFLPIVGASGGGPLQASIGALPGVPSGAFWAVFRPLLASFGGHLVPVGNTIHPHWALCQVFGRLVGTTMGHKECFGMHFG